MKTLTLLTAALGALLIAPVLHATDYALASDGTAGQSANAAIGGGRLVNKWSFCAWVFITEGGSYALPDSPVALLTSQESPPSGVSAEVLLTDNGGTQRLEIGRSNYYYGLQSTGAVPLNQWVHVAVTVSSTNQVSYYINGVAAGTADYTGKDATIGGTAGTGTGFVRFMGNGVARKFKGRMDDVQIWSNVLTQAQIQGYMSTPPAGNEGALAAWFRCDEGTGTSAGNADAVNSSGSATLTGGVMWVPGASSRFVVANTNDSGDGSLRQAVAYAVESPGADTITFAPALSGQTIVVNSEIPVDDAGGLITDAAALPRGITIKAGPGGNRHFNSQAGTILTLRGLNLVGGQPTDAGGGAIYNKGTSLTLTRCLLSGNSAALYTGGAIYSLGPLTLTDCSFSGNSSVAGGAVFCASGTAVLTNCTFTGNTANNFGGAINSSVPLTLTHCTVSGNLADTGGGISNYLSTVTLTNCIVAGNTGAAAFDVYNFQGFVVRAGANIIQFLRNSSDPGDSGPPAINAAPLLAALADNGGPTPTMALLSGSPALDAVPAASIIPGLTTDQRGFSRHRDGNAIAGALPDIGAYEAQTPPASGPEQIVVTTAADENDPAGTLGSGISLREAVRAAAPGRSIGFDPAVFTAAAHTIILDSAKGEITLTRSATIDAGNLAAGVTVDGGPGDRRLFYLPPGPGVSLLGLTLTGGNGSGLVSDGYGGAILNYATLALTRCTLSGNAAGASASSAGGAILNVGTLTLTQCTLSGNSNAFGSGGGAIYNHTGPLTLTDCTLSGNDTFLGGGGAIFNYTGTLTLRHCTLSGNSASSGGAIYNQNSLTLNYAIVAGNTSSFGSGGDIFNQGTVTRVGTNLVQSLTNDAGGTSSGPAALTADPLLATLANYGGPTQTMALRLNSPARNAAVGSTSTSDQRGYPIIGTADIGAYEAGSFTTCPVYILESLPATATAAQLAPSFDYDGDGATNQDEWNALTDPASPRSVLRITGTVRSAGNLLINIPTVTGRKYSLWRSDTLLTWTNTGLPLIVGNGASQTFSIPAPIAGILKRYYRAQTGP